MTTLVIVESPAKARTIGRFLGPDYRVLASRGHVRDLPASPAQLPDKLRSSPWARLGVDVDADFRPLYVVPPKAAPVVKELRAALRGADAVLLATDEDREGEAIAWHLLEVLKPAVPVHRMVFHEITRPAIEAAVAAPRALDRDLVAAQEARRVLDRLVGWDVSSLLWRKVAPKLSAGRVQSVAARLVVERERARRAFRDAQHWGVEATFRSPAAPAPAFAARLAELGGIALAAGKDFDPSTGRLAEGTVRVVLDEIAAGAIADAFTATTFTIADVATADWRRSPAPPFTTSTLQQEASRKLRMAPKAAMRVAQSLYERGFITYPRTDAVNLADSAVTGLRAEIRRRFGDDYLPPQPRRYRTKVANAQEAHEAIRPAGDRPRAPETLAGELSRDELRLYRLIWDRTLACQMADARGTRTTARLTAPLPDGVPASVVAPAGAEIRGEAVFVARGRHVTFPGFLAVYVEDADDPAAALEDREPPLPPLLAGDPASPDHLQPVGHRTEPPARYTEASLVKELEARGIGRPSTYATVIDTLTARGYVDIVARALVPTWTAFGVVGLLEAQLAELVAYDFTAQMESDLDRIASGATAAAPWLHAFYLGDDGLCDRLGRDVDARQACATSLGAAHDSGDGGDGGDQIEVRVGRYGPFLSCGDRTAPVPAGVAPADLDIEAARAALAAGGVVAGGDDDADDAAGGPGAAVELGTDPASGLIVTRRTGRFGPYVSLGDTSTPKAKRRNATIPSEWDPTTVDLARAVALLSLPRVVGTLDGAPVEAALGRYGPYLRHGDKTRDLPSVDAVFSIELDAAATILAAPKPPRRKKGATTRAAGRGKSGTGGPKAKSSAKTSTKRASGTASASRSGAGRGGRSARTTEGLDLGTSNVVRSGSRRGSGATGGSSKRSGTTGASDAEGAKPTPRPRRPRND